MIKNKETLKYFIPLIFITLVVLGITYSHHNGLIIDCGREAYYPQEILNGKVLYKDLFNIYGPFSYIFNAILFKIFVNNLNTLYIAGSFCAFGIISTLFFIAKRFLSASFGLYICCFALAIGIIPVNIFNYVYPYSFGMTYGLLACLISILAFTNYADKKNIVALCLGMFFAGLAVCCKYEFIAFLLIIPYILFKTKTSFCALNISLLSFLFIPVFCINNLFIQGLRIENLIDTFNITNVMSHTQTLKYFYIHSGIFFHKQTIPLFLATFLCFMIPFSVYMAPVWIKNKIQNPSINLILTYTGICLLFLFKVGSFYDLYAFTPALLLLLIFINYKKISNNLPLFILVPFFAAVILTLGYNKLTAMLSTVGAILVGNIGATYSTDISYYINNYLNLGVNNEILTKIIFLIIITFLFIMFILKGTKIKTNSKKNKKNENNMESIPLYEVNSKKKSTIPLIVIFIVCFVLLIVNMINWEGIFNITWFSEVYNQITSIKIGDYSIVSNLIGTITSF